MILSVPPLLCMEIFLPIVLTGSSFHSHRWWFEYELQIGGRQRGSEFLYAPFVIPIKLTCSALTSIHRPSSHPSLPHRECHNLSLPRSSIHQCPIQILILELPPTAIHPFNPPNGQSVPQPGVPHIPWPFYTPINFRNVTLQPFTQPCVYQSCSI